MRRKHFLLGIGLLGIVSLSACADEHMQQIEEPSVESESNIDTSETSDEASDETVNMEIQWESNSLDVNGNRGARGTFLLSWCQRDVPFVMVGAI